MGSTVTYFRPSDSVETVPLISMDSTPCEPVPSTSTDITPPEPVQPVALPSTSTASCCSPPEETSSEETSSDETSSDATSSEETSSDETSSDATSSDETSSEEEPAYNVATFQKYTDEDGNPLDDEDILKQAVEESRIEHEFMGNLDTESAFELAIALSLKEAQPPVDEQDAEPARETTANSGDCCTMRITDLGNTTIERSEQDVTTALEEVD
jgi:hypothetical protein